MSALTLDAILRDLNRVSEKTASALSSDSSPTRGKVAKAEGELADALKRAESAVESTKTAGEATQATPIASLTKMASDIASAEQAAMVKEANLYGAAVADGFMARLRQYDEAAADMPNGTKTASSEIDVEKIAEEAVRGYIETKESLEKQAATDFQLGYDETVAKLEKIASDCFERGAQACESVLDSIQH